MDTSGRILLAAAALCVAVAVPLTVHAGLEHSFLISGKKLLIKDNANSAKRVAVFISTDALISFHANGDEPTNVGMSVKVQGACHGSSFFYLPKTRWTEKNGKFKYKDQDIVDGPVKAAIAQDGLVKVVAKGSAFDFSLLGTGPQGGVAVFVESQESIWTAFFGPGNAKIKKDDPVKGVFSAVNASAAEPPRSSCEGLHPLRF